MAKLPEHDEGKAASGASPDSKSAEGSTAPSKVAAVISRLKRIASFAMRCSPILSILALIIAAIAVTGNLSSQEQLGTAAAKVESLNASLLASRAELEELKLTLAKNKATQDTERNKNDDLAAEIIRNVTNIQIRMKSYPTLEEQLVQRTSAVTAAPPSPTTPTARHR